MQKFQPLSSSFLSLVTVYVSWSCLKEIFNEAEVKSCKFPWSPQATDMPASVTEIQIEWKEDLGDTVLWWGYQVHPHHQSQVSCLFSLFPVAFPYSRLLPMANKIESTALSSSVSNSPTLLKIYGKSPLWAIKRNSIKWAYSWHLGAENVQSKPTELPVQ